MANNGVVKFLTSAKAILGIAAVLVALIVWFVSMGSDVQSVQAENMRQEKAAEALRHCVTENTRTLVKVETQLKAVDEKVERIDTRQETIRSEITERLDRIWEKVK